MRNCDRLFTEFQKINPWQQTQTLPEYSTKQTKTADLGGCLTNSSVPATNSSTRTCDPKETPPESVHSMFRGVGWIIRLEAVRPADRKPWRAEDVLSVKSPKLCIQFPGLFQAQKNEVQCPPRRKIGRFRSWISALPAARDLAEPSGKSPGLGRALGARTQNWDAVLFVYTAIPELVADALVNGARPLLDWGAPWCWRTSHCGRSSSNSRHNSLRNSDAG
jgi:hypothetical protein